MLMSPEQIQELEKIAEQNDGHCDRCSRTIKIYRYKINRSHCLFLRAMANKIRLTGNNNVDISNLGLPYSIRTQVTKMRLHGLIAQVKNDGEKQARRWLITHKGWKFLNHESIPEKVIVFNNTVLGHDGDLVNIFKVMGEKFDLPAPLYGEAPVGQVEARVYHDIRTTRKGLSYKAVYQGNKYLKDRLLEYGKAYDIIISSLEMGKPVSVDIPAKATIQDYIDVGAFQRAWKIIKE